MMHERIKAALLFTLVGIGIALIEELKLAQFIGMILLSGVLGWSLGSKSLFSK